MPSNGDNLLFCVTNNMSHVPNVNDINDIINDYESKEMKTYKNYGDLTETKLAVQAATMWDLIYTPAQPGFQK